MLDQFYQFLASMGYPEPLHPSNVHIPIGLVVGAIVFVYIAVIFRRQSFSLSARHCLVFAFIWLFPTAILGIMDWQHFYHGAWLLPIIVKLILAPTLAVLMVITIICAYKIGPTAKSALLLYILCLAATGGLGFLGEDWFLIPRLPLPRRIRKHMRPDNSCSVRIVPVAIQKAAMSSSRISHCWDHPICRISIPLYPLFATPVCRTANGASCRHFRLPKFRIPRPGICMAILPMCLERRQGIRVNCSETRGSLGSQIPFSDTARWRLPLTDGRSFRWFRRLIFLQGSVRC